MRNFLVQNSRVIIQDDSGIPLRMFPKGWKSELLRPLFVRTSSKYYQPDLAALVGQNETPRFSLAIIGKKRTASLCLRRAKLYGAPGRAAIAKVRPKMIRRRRVAPR